MRFSPTKFLHGLLCTAPILLLTLAACGGGGSSPAPLDVYYNVIGSVNGHTSDGLVLLNNGGDPQVVASGVTGFSFAPINTGYNVTVLSHPDHNKCDVTNGSGPRQAVDVTSVIVNCAPAFTISAAITNVTGTGLVLQNNGRDNMLIPASSAAATQTFTFSTPVIDAASYVVSVLTQPHTPAQDCAPTSTSSGTVSGVDVTVSIACGPVVTPPPADRYVYTANNGSTGTNGVSTYTSASGVLTAGALASTGSGPSSIAVDPAGQFAYVTNSNSNSISAYSISGGVLAPLDLDALTAGNQNTIATGKDPVNIAIHPSGKFAYVVNYLANSVSAYSIDAAGVLARIDSNGATTANETSIPARNGSISIAIHPEGGYAYVANAFDNSVSVYSIDTVSGALTAIDANGSTGGTGGPSYISTNGTLPYSLKVDPAGQYLYVANRTTNQVSIFAIGGAGGPGTLSMPNVQTVADNGASDPVTIAMHPTKQFAYVVNSGNKTVNVYSTATAGWGSWQSFAPTGKDPIAISIDRTGQYAYVANSGDSTISAYSINATTGVLTPVASPFSAGTSPYGVTTAP
jgi:6-phosphogluconolactonase (cycloisomerase 2 family)